MKKAAALVLLTVLFFTSCSLFNGYGKKVKVGDNIEIYYKGKGVTEDQAKTVGEFMQEHGFGDKAFTMQLTKDEDDKNYLVKMVYNEDYYKKNKALVDRTFSVFTDLMSQNVFDGEPVSIALVEKEKMEPYETINPISKAKSGTNYVYYNSDNVSKKIAEDFAKKLEKENFYTTYGNPKLYLSKEDGDYVLRFEENKKALKKEGDDRYKAIMENLQYIFTKYTLEKPIKLVVIDKTFNDVKQFDDISADRQARLDQLMTGQQDPTNETPQTTTTEEVEGGGM